MPDNPSDPSSPLTAVAGRDRLRRLTEGAKTLGVVKAAVAAGLFDQLRSARSVGDLRAALPAVDETSLTRVLDVLVATDVLRLDGGLYVLPADVAALNDDVIGIDLDAVVSEALLEVQRSPHVLESPHYPEADDALTLAEVSGGHPVPAMLGLLDAAYAAVPAFRERLNAGGPFLDAGAGIGGNLLAAATLFPELHATGVESDAVVARELEQRVAAAGLADRVTVRHGDIRELELEGFAVAYWAQSFFPAETRAASLAAVVKALDPGGILLVQELFPAPTEGDVGGMLDQLVMSSWGMAYGEGPAELADELEAAGLTTEPPVTTPLGRLVAARKP